MQNEKVMTTPKNLPTIEEDIRPFLLTDPRRLNALKREISGSQQVQNQLEELGNIEGYLNSVEGGQVPSGGPLLMYSSVIEGDIAKSFLASLTRC